MLGIGAMTYAMKGGSSKKADKYYGRTISAATISEQRLELRFSDGVKVWLFDDGQSCCEHRYMRTDDDVSSLVGTILTKVEIGEVKETSEGDYDVTESCFLTLTTSAGTLTIANYNTHNGYYGGFGLSIKEIEEKSNG